MTRLFLFFLKEDGYSKADAALKELRRLAEVGAVFLDGPIKADDHIPPLESDRLSRAAEILKEAARRRRIAEGLARAKREGRRIGRRPIGTPASISQIVLARDSGRSWREIEEEYHVPITSARRYYQKVLFERQKHKAHKTSRKEANPH